MRILLICSAGMSTSLLVTKMKDYSETGDKIEALSFEEFGRRSNEFDVVLVGPQLRHKYRKVEQFCRENGIFVGLLDAVTFGIMDGEAAYKQAVEIYNSSEKK